MTKRKGLRVGGRLDVIDRLVTIEAVIRTAQLACEAGDSDPPKVATVLYEHAARPLRECITDLQKEKS